jgi:pimeloyl-ACP methyl ester carboxylesterase
MYFKTAEVAGLRLFYREAGDASKPTIVLLHGFPSSSYQFHDLIPLLVDRFHVVAPDYPGMGYSEAPDATALRPTFDDVAIAIDVFIAQCAPAPLICTCTTSAARSECGSRRPIPSGSPASFFRT